jgi:concentrative nucleoside transporter, CNT family
MERLTSLLGLLVFVAIAYILSIKRRAISWKPVLWGVALQFLFALIILRSPWGLKLFQALGDGVTYFLDYSDAGAKFLFGEKFKDFYIAFKVLPTIIFFSAFISVLYHFGILQRVVNFLAQIMMRFMNTSGSESLSAAANIFVGQTEAPLVIKPYMPTATMSELHAVMTGGFATIAGGVMAAYISFGVSATHLLAASVMSAPAALAISKVMYPETEDSPTKGTRSMPIERTTVNVIDAIGTGTLEGLQLALNVGAMLIAFLGLLAVVNGVLGWIGGWFQFPTLSLEFMLSYIMAPFAWLMGVPWADCLTAGALLGKKTILNEFIAYADLANLTKANGLSDRAATILTYALCGFANIGSIGIQIGGLGALAPDRRQDLARIGFRAMIAGTLACFMTAAIAGMLL